MQWHPAHVDSSTRATVATLEIAHVEADVEIRRGRTRLVWRWSQDGSVLVVVRAGEA